MQKPTTLTIRIGGTPGIGCGGGGGAGNHQLTSQVVAKPGDFQQRKDKREPSKAWVADCDETPSGFHFRLREVGRIQNDFHLKPSRVRRVVCYLRTRLADLLQKVAQFVRCECPVDLHRDGV